MKESNLSLEGVRSDQELCALLGDLCVEIGEHLNEDWYGIDGLASFDSFGGEGAGGRYILLPDERILFISSEGSAGTIAENMHDFLDLVSGAPYWGDMLNFSDGGDLALMVQAEFFLKNDPEFEDDYPRGSVKRIRELAGLGALKDGYAVALHRCVKAGDKNPRVMAPDGWVYHDLFGRFKPTDNPRWKNV